MANYGINESVDTRWRNSQCTSGISSDYCLSLTTYNISIDTFVAWTESRRRHFYRLDSWPAWRWSRFATSGSVVIVVPIIAVISRPFWCRWSTVYRWRPQIRFCRRVGGQSTHQVSRWLPRLSGEHRSRWRHQTAERSRSQAAGWICRICRPGLWRYVSTWSSVAYHQHILVRATDFHIRRCRLFRVRLKHLLSFSVWYHNNTALAVDYKFVFLNCQGDCQFRKVFSRNSLQYSKESILGNLHYVLYTLVLIFREWRWSLTILSYTILSPRLTLRVSVRLR